MKEVKVFLHSMEEMQSFVAVTSKFPEKLDLMPQDDEFTRVSGKSVMGIFSLDCSHPLLLRIHADDARAEEICTALKAFVIA